MLVNVAETKCKIIHFRKHSGFVRDVNITVVVVHKNIPACSCGRLEVEKACPVRSHNFSEQNLCVDFDEMISAAVDIENVFESFLVKLQKSPHLISGFFMSANRKPIRTYWPQENRMK